MIRRFGQRWATDLLRRSGSGNGHNELQKWEFVLMSTLEKHYPVRNLADMWSCSGNTVLFFSCAACRFSMSLGSCALAYSTAFSRAVSQLLVLALIRARSRRM